MNTPHDLIVVGGGPAGSAAAIAAADHGLSVLLLERLAAPRERPGETVHPGVEVLFEHLGVAEAVRAANFHRHEGCYLETATGCSYQAFGADSEGPWRGFQVRRDRLDRILVREAERRGAAVMPGAAVQALHRGRGGRVTGVTVDGTDYEGRWVVDASGAAGWLRRQMGIAAERCSPQLFAWYGYVDGPPPRCDGNPRLIVEPDGWTWIAPLGHHDCAWVRLSIEADRERPQTPPAPLAGCAPRGPVRGMDVSWRVLERVAGPGFFGVGDAASMIDPASSHGILTALMSGIMAAHCIAQVEVGNAAETAAIDHYQHWLRDAFEADVQALLDLYGELGIATAGWSSGRIRQDAVANL